MPRYSRQQNKRFGCLGCSAIVGAALFVLFIGCLGVGFYHSYTTNAELEAADKNWDNGKRADAVVIYQKHYNHSKTKATHLVRIVEHLLIMGMLADARTWVEKGLDEKIPLTYQTQAAIDLSTRVVDERAAKAEADRLAKEEKDRVAKEEKEKSSQTVSHTNHSEQGSDGKTYLYDSSTEQYYYKDTSGRIVHVSGYHRKDGSYVQPHTRSSPGAGKTGTVSGGKTVSGKKK